MIVTDYELVLLGFIFAIYLIILGFLVDFPSDS